MYLVNREKTGYAAYDYLVYFVLVQEMGLFLENLMNQIFYPLYKFALHLYLFAELLDSVEDMF